MKCPRFSSDWISHNKNNYTNTPLSDHEAEVTSGKYGMWKSMNYMACVYQWTPFRSRWLCRMSVHDYLCIRKYILSLFWLITPQIQNYIHHSRSLKSILKRHNQHTLNISLLLEWFIDCVSVNTAGIIRSKESIEMISHLLQGV